MPELLHPGIYTVERPSGSMPIEGVGTNTTAFVGYAKSGPFGEPTLITSWSQFCRIFGEDEAKVLGLLEAQGRTPWESIDEKQQLNKETWLDYLRYVYINSDAMDSKMPDEKEYEWRKFMKKNELLDSTPYLEFKVNKTVNGQVKTYISNSYLAHAVRGYFDNGGSRAYIVRVASDLDFQAHRGSNQQKLIARFEPEKAQAQLAGRIFARAITAGADGNKMQVHIEKHEAGKTIEPPVAEAIGEDGKAKAPAKDTGLSKDSGPAGVSYTITVTQDRTQVAKQQVALKELEQKRFSVANLLEIVAEEGSLTALTSGTVRLEGGKDSHPTSLGNVRGPEDFEGDEVSRSGRRGLKPFDDVNMVCVPDLMARILIRQVVQSTNGSGKEETRYSPEELDEDFAKDTMWQNRIINGQQGLVDFCEASNDRMAILDSQPKRTVQQVRNDIYGGSNSNFGCGNGQAAAYYPWLKVADPAHPGYQVFVPPCGHVAGVWARVVTERGVHKAPANEPIRGVVELENKISDGDQDTLNPIGINCIRNFPGQGIRIWGGRTLATEANPSYRYVNVRRLINYMKKSLERGLQWAVFEPNDSDLWGRVSRNVSAFLFTEWKDGKLFGTVPEQAFFVQCNASNNPQEMIDQGRLNVEIGVNPVKPAEFIVLSIGQWDGGSSSSERTQ